MNNSHPIWDTVKHIGDAVSIAVVLGSLAQWLPPAAALATLLWTVMRMYEMVTGNPFSQSSIAKWITGR